MSVVAVTSRQISKCLAEDSRIRHYRLHPSAHIDTTTDPHLNGLDIHGRRDIHDSARCVVHMSVGCQCALSYTMVCAFVNLPIYEIWVNYCRSLRQDFNFKANFVYHSTAASPWHQTNTISDVKLQVPGLSSTPSVYICLIGLISYSYLTAVTVIDTISIEYLFSGYVHISCRRQSSNVFT